MITEVTPDSTDFFTLIKRQAKAIEVQVSQIDKLAEKRNKLFKDCMGQYQKYILKENELLDRNSKHCEQRDQWYREEVNKSWGIAVNNRNLILRSVARTNVLKKDISEWLERIEEGGSMSENQHQSFLRGDQQDLEGSRLIDKYNQILLEYGHKV